MKFYSAFYKALKQRKPKIEALNVARQVVPSKEPYPFLVRSYLTRRRVNSIYLLFIDTLFFH